MAIMCIPIAAAPVCTATPSTRGPPPWACQKQQIMLSLCNWLHNFYAVLVCIYHPSPSTIALPSTPRNTLLAALLQVVQTVTGVFLQEAQGGTATASSLGNLYVAATGCPAAPADFVTGDTLGPAAPDNTGSTTPTTDGSGSSGSGGTSGGSGGTQVPDTSSTEPLPPGVSVVVGDVTSQRSATPNWDVSMVPVADNVTYTRGVPAAVSFKVSWEKTKPVSTQL